MGNNMPSDRPLLTASVNEETLERYRIFAAAHGISVSGFIEAVGRNLPGDDESLSSWQRRTVTMARSIDADRRRRKPSPD